MFRSTVEQEEALTEASVSNAEGLSLRDKTLFIGSFLLFAGKVVKQDGRIPMGRVLNPSREVYWQSESTSRVIKAPTEPDSPTMGTSLTAYRTGFTRTKLVKSIDLGSHVHAVDVNVGVMYQGSQPLPTLLGSKVVLRVTEYPPAVYYGPQQAELTNVEPNTENWSEVNRLVDELYAQEQLLLGNRPQPTAK